jgi:hypothetical protein
MINLPSRAVILFAAAFALSACATPGAVPKGFASYDDFFALRAVSPDGVTFTVRNEDNDPEASLEFWSEALKKRMTDAGYRFVADAALEADGREGYLLELSAPLGQQDYTFLIGLFVVEDELIIAEAAGEMGRLATRRLDLVEAISALRF